MLTNLQKRHLKALAHERKPVVLIGANGLTEAVLAEIEQALSHHELLKVRVGMDDREQRKATMTQISETLNAELVQSIGHIATYYRHNPEQNKVVLP